MTLKTVSDLAESIKPILECLAYFAGSLALVKWLRERNDRATDVLLSLEEQFETKCAAGRQYIDEPLKYDECRKALAGAGECGVAVSGSQLQEHLQIVKSIDDLLRFYVVLVGVRQARQLPDSSLSTCYRFWLAHYYRPDRVEFRHYVNENFPTLRAWLLRDTSLWQRLKERPFSPWWRPFFRCDFWPVEEVDRNASRLFHGS
jgi:hypothetical protein